MKRIFSIFIILLSLFSFKFTAYAEDVTAVPDIESEASLLMDLNTGQILYEKNINERLAPASTTKIMTALLTLENCCLSDKITVGPDPPFEEGSKIFIFEDEIISINDLMHAMLLVSANDAASALAEHIAGSKEAFAELMNKRAKELGCTDTNFVNPNGLYEDNHYTTAHDLAIIAKKAMENDVFRNIIKTLRYEIQPTNKQTEVRYLHNINKLLTPTKYKYDGADGIKNGYTTKSKNTLVSSAQRDGVHLLAVSLKASSHIYEDNIKLFDYGFDSFKPIQAISKLTDEYHISIKNTSIEIPVHPSKDLSILVPKNDPGDIPKNFVINSEFTDIRKGQEVGYVSVSYGNSTFDVPLIADESYASPVFNLTKNKDGSYSRIMHLHIYSMLIILGVCAIVLAAFILIRHIRKKRTISL